MATPPAGVTCSKLLPGYEGEQGALLQGAMPGELPRKKFRKHQGTKVRLGRPDDDDAEADAHDEDEEGDDEGGVVRAGMGASAEGSGGAASSRITLPKFKESVAFALKEFFMSGDTEECLRRIRELRSPFFTYEFIRRAVTAAIERDDTARELTSRMLSYGYGIDFSMDQIAKGFGRLFETIDDLALDVPACRSLLAKFLARAVADEILPPSFLANADVLAMGGDVIEDAKSLLSIKHSGSHLEHVWHVNAAFSIQDMKTSVANTLREYFSALDVGEGVRCLRELNAPHFMHEVVYRALVLVIEGWPAPERSEQAATLFKALQVADVLGKQQTAKGFARVKSGLPDLALDVPAAPAAFAHLLAGARQHELLPSDADLDAASTA